LIDISRFSFSLQCKEEIVLPRFAPATIRGAFGIILKRLVCVRKYKERDCKECILKDSCVYSYIFEKYFDKNGQKDPFYMSEPPHPFILDVPFNKKTVIIPKNSYLKWCLSLFGERIRQVLPYVILTMEKMGESGIGRNRGKFEIDHIISVSESNQNVIYHAAKRSLDTDIYIEKLSHDSTADRKVKKIEIEFITPLRLKSGGKITLNPEFYELITNIVRRYSALIQFYQSDNLDFDKISNMIDEAKTIQTIENNTEWVEYSRFSGRQKHWIKLGGIVGKMSFSGNITPFTQWLEIAKKINIAKSTSFGFGKIKYTMQ